MLRSSLISIVIPTYNSGDSLKVTLDSIASQSFKDYEVLCIDGLSTDNTLSIIKANAELDSRIKFLSEKDDGIYDAMNKGIYASNSAWLYFLGSDDCLHDSSVLEDIARILISTDADVIYGDAILLSDKQRYGGIFDLLRLHTIQNLCHQTMFYRSTVFEKLGNYNTFYKVLADWDFNIRCFRHPFIKTKYIERDIVVFNNLTGISSMPYEDPLYKEIPVLYIKEIERLKSNRLLNSNLYVYSKKVYSLLRKYF